MICPVGVQKEYAAHEKNNKKVVFTGRIWNLNFVTDHKLPAYHDGHQEISHERVTEVICCCCKLSLINNERIDGRVCGVTEPEGKLPP